MKSTTSEQPRRSAIQRITALTLVAAMLLTFLSAFPPSNAITASAAGSPKKQIITTAPYETTTTTTETTTTSETTATTVSTAHTKKTIETTVPLTTSEITTTTEMATTTESTTTESSTTTTETTEATTSATQQTTAYTKKTILTTEPITTQQTTVVTTEVSTGKKKPVSGTVPYVLTEDDSWGSFPTEPVFAHMGFIPKSNGWWRLVNNYSEAELIAKYNGFNSISDVYASGWYAIPPGMACKVETGLYVPKNVTLWSVVHDVQLVEEILAYNGGSYSGTVVKIPAGMALNVNPTYFENFEESEIEEPVIVSEMTAVSELTTETTEVTLDSSLLYEKEQAEKLAEEAEKQRAEAEKLAEEAEKQKAAAEKQKEEAEKQAAEAAKQAEEAAKQAERAAKDKEAAEAAEREVRQKLSDALHNAEQIAKEVDSYQKLTNQLAVENSVLLGDFNKMMQSLNVNLFGFAFGTDEQAIMYCNENAIFSANCAAKPAVVALLLQKLAENEISLDTKVVIRKSDMAPSTTWMSPAHGFDVGTETNLLECGYCAISMSDNTSYNIIKRYLKEEFDISVDQWRLEMFNHFMDGGSYGKISAKDMYREAQYVLDYLKTNTAYSNCLKDWLRMEDTYYDSVFVEALDMKFSYTGFKIGWYNQSQTEMVFLQDEFGNWYIAVFLTKANGDDIITRIADWIDERYKMYIDYLLKNQDSDE